MQIRQDYEICYFDDVSADLPSRLFGKYPIIRSFEEARAYFENEDPGFALGLGGPLLREKFFHAMKEIGGAARCVVSPACSTGHFGVEIGEGSTLLGGVIVESFARLGRGCLINLSCTVAHESVVGDFCELGPGVHLSGRCVVGSRTTLGSGAVVLPGIRIGKDVVVGAGAVVIRDLPDGITVAGVPARPLGNPGHQP